MFRNIQKHTTIIKTIFTNSGLYHNLIFCTPALTKLIIAEYKSSGKNNIIITL